MTMTLPRPPKAPTIRIRTTHERVGTKNDAEACRRLGWTPGTILEGEDVNGYVLRLELTAIGDRLITARHMPRSGPPGKEMLVSLGHRDWRAVER